MEADWFVYMIEAQNGFLYTGVTTDPKRRFIEHSTPAKQAKFFRRSPPKAMVFSYPCQGRSIALRLEAWVKSLSRSEKIALTPKKIAAQIKLMTA